MSTMATNLASGALSESRQASATNTISEKNDKTTNCISQFFRPKPEPIVEKVTSLLHMQEKNTVIVLDDDSDDYLDDKKIDVVNLTGGLTSKSIREKRNQKFENGNNDEYDEQCSLLQGQRNTRKCGEDIVHENSSHCDQGIRNYPSNQHLKRYNNDINSSPQISSREVDNKNENPFSKFSHVEPFVSKNLCLNNKKKSWRPHSLASRNKMRKNSIEHTEINPLTGSRSKKIHTPLLQNKKKEKKLVKICDISHQEQIKIIRKWHSMADPLAPLQARRFQILLAARLHARCKEITVRKAMQKLREHFSSKSETKTITVEEIAKSDPKELAIHLSNLQFYNAKAKQIVKAAQEIQIRHGGIVPENEFSLLQITGIGKTFADLLAFVNKRETHERFRTTS